MTILLKPCKKKLKMIVVLNLKDVLKIKKKEQRLRDAGTRHGSMEKESLLSDNQVKRALDILISYEIFKGLKG